MTSSLLTCSLCGRFLHNEMLYAVAQKRYLYIYDHTGLELHCLKKHDHVNRLTFLPYHFLLVSAVSGVCSSCVVTDVPLVTG